MAIGLSTYAYTWRTAGLDGMTIDAMLGDAAALGVELVQLCDWAPLEHLADGELAALRRSAEQHGLRFETGTRGVEPDRIRRHISIAQKLGAPLIRSMIPAGSGSDVVASLSEVVPDLERAAIGLALETYEEIPTPRLVEIVEQVGSPALGICLDLGNVIGAAESPHEVLRLTAPHLLNIHVKDFGIERLADRHGFIVTGRPLGHGLLDVPSLISLSTSTTKEINLIVENWVPSQPTTTAARQLEHQWTVQAIEHLRSNNA